jgi:hypothetical protein
LQHQNSNLTEELPALLEDVDPELPWASAAFGAAPEAVNLWIGDHRSATTFHKDHYENMYVVLRGTKVFHLLPPTDCYRMALQVQPLAQYVKVSGGCLPWRWLADPAVHASPCSLRHNACDHEVCRHFSPLGGRVVECIRFVASLLLYWWVPVLDMAMLSGTALPHACC